MSTACCPAPVAPAANETTGAWFHTSLNCSDLKRSIEFYRLLLGLEPVKVRPDYAKFEMMDPPLVLTLMPGRPAPGGIVNHFGLRVQDSETLVKIQERLELGGIRTKREEGVACCYALQIKFWVTDPDQAFWEIYVVHEDIDEHGDDHMPSVEEVSGRQAEPAALRTVWQHHIGEPFPDKIPHTDNSVHEVLCEGTANVSPDKLPLSSCLAEILRVLRPGGELRLHGLSGDAPLTVPLPALPGPAAVVEHVPAHFEVVQALVGAGFGSVFLEKLSSTAHFTVGEVPLRELMITARKPGHRVAARSKQATYLGPMASVTDDHGNTFRRGEPVSLNTHDWQALSKSPAAGSFLLL
ncbi:MAG TPA: ArsI/CadI family heavy metal resistance metalloenzyme [Verrucomicrobiales bacterium]|jgi:catechol 2,3-dioxygenase-like lactoylglutathione lyase family enzyme|nr:ArsI/CadI family heavy metal resistance metalloenzyme [Verrucomicrobiales bacterium]